MMGSMRQMHGVASGRIRTIGVDIARGCINVVLVDVAKFFIHGIAIHGFTFIRFLLPAKIAGVDKLSVGFIRYHGMAPPVCHRPQVIIVVVCHCIPHLHFSKAPLATHYTYIVHSNLATPIIFSFVITANIILRSFIIVQYIIIYI